MEKFKKLTAIVFGIILLIWVPQVAESDILSTSKKNSRSNGGNGSIWNDAALWNASDIVSSEIGDVNNDGIKDFVITRSEKLPADFGRKSYLVFGTSKGLPTNIDLSALDGKTGLVLHGIAAHAFSAKSVKQVRDANRSLNTASIGSCNRYIANNDPFDPSGMEKKKATSIGVGPTYYSQIDLSEFAQDSGYCMALNLNDSGQVVGYAYSPEGQHAFLYENGTMLDLGTLGGHASYAYGVNNFGHVVGYSLTGETGPSGWEHCAFLFDGTMMHNLGTLGGDFSDARAINDNGQIAGSSMIMENEAYHAFLLQVSQMDDLMTLGGTDSFAYNINTSGQVVGKSRTGNWTPNWIEDHAFLYDGSMMRDIGSLGYFCLSDEEGIFLCLDESAAYGINNSGQVVGASTTEEGWNHAFFYENDSLSDLGTLGGNQSWAYDINDSGQAVGISLTAGDAAYHAFLYQNGEMYDLNDFIVENPSKNILPSAYAINNFGQIIGWNYLLNPIYEEVKPKEDLILTEKLGKTLRFEYWFQINDETEQTMRGAKDGLAIKITPQKGSFAFTEQFSFNSWVERDFCGKSAWKKMLSGLSFQRFIKGWQQVGESVSACESSTNWKTVSIDIPDEMVGMELKIRFRVKDLWPKTNPTVFLRNINTFGNIVD